MLDATAFVITLVAIIPSYGAEQKCCPAVHCRKAKCAKRLEKDPIATASRER